ncbi:MAG: hypothetical protein ABR606_03165 [Vicinamibacterales bacterium]
MSLEFLRSERMLEHSGVTENTWRDAGKKDKNFLESESPLFVGRAVVALAEDPARLDRSGQLFRLWTGLPITANPWIGTDAPMVATIRERIDGPALVPDSPPLTTRQRARHRLQLAEGVEEAYAAIYAHGEAEADPIVVYGLRRADAQTPAEQSRAPRASENPRIIRVAIGSIVAVVHGDGGKCFQAVGAYLRSLAR